MRCQDGTRLLELLKWRVAAVRRLGDRSSGGRDEGGGGMKAEALSPRGISRRAVAAGCSGPESPPRCSRQFF